MMADDRLKQSVHLMAKVLARLESGGVAKQVLTASEFLADAPAEDQAELFDNLVDWLADEGVVRLTSNPSSGTEPDEWCYELVLTAYGFRMLSQKLGGDLDLTLREAVKQVNTGKPGWSSLGDFLGGLFGGFTKSLSN